jgi:hypothetical protein
VGRHMKFNLSASKRGPAAEAGFTVVEAVAALAVIALGLGQVSEIVHQAARVVSETRAAAEHSSVVLAKVERANRAEMAGAGAQQVLISDRVFEIGADKSVGTPCFFDTTGRRCR